MTRETFPNSRIELPMVDPQPPNKSRDHLQIPPIFKACGQLIRITCDLGLMPRLLCMKCLG